MVFPNEIFHNTLLPFCQVIFRLLPALVMTFYVADHIAVRGADENLSSKGDQILIDTLGKQFYS